MIPNGWQTRADLSLMIEAATTAAWATDKGQVIGMAIIDALRGAKIALPSPSTIERAGIDPSDGGTKVQPTDLTAVEEASIVASAGPSFFAPQSFLSRQTLKEQIDQTADSD